MNRFERLRTLTNAPSQRERASERPHRKGSPMRIASIALLCAAGCSAAPSEDAVASHEALATATYNFGTLVSPGKCLDISGGGTADGTNVQEWTCNGTGAQAWTLEDLGNGAARLVNPQSGKCLDVSGAGTANGTN